MPSESPVDGVSFAYQKMNEVQQLSAKHNNRDIEELCQAAIVHMRGGEPKPKPNLDELSQRMLAAGVSPMDVNFNLRFSRPWDPNEKLKKKPNIFGIGQLSPCDYENITNPALLSSPITDIMIVAKSEEVPEGYFRIARTPTNKRANLNTSSGGNQLYYCIKKGIDDKSPPITSLVVIYPDKKEYVPPGYSVVKRAGKPCNHNAGTSAERIFLCYKRDPCGNPITDLQIYFPTKGEVQPTSFHSVDRSIRNHVVDLNMSTSGMRINLCYRQRLRTLECLMPSYYLASASHASMRLRPNGSASPVVMAALLQEANTVTTPEPVERPRSNLYENRRLSNDSMADLEVESRDDDDRSDNEEEVKSTMDDDVQSEQGDDSIGNTSVLSGNDLTEGADAGQITIVTADEKAVPVAPKALLHPMLATIFARGELFEFGLNLLQNLLTTTFYDNDFAAVLPPHYKTMLDLTIEVLCERIDSCNEILNQRLLGVLNTIIAKAKGALSRASIDKIFRTTSFLNSCFSTRNNWIPAGYPAPVHDDTSELCSVATQRELIHTLCSRAEEAELEDMLPDVVYPFQLMKPKLYDISFVDRRDVGEDAPVPQCTAQSDTYYFLQDIVIEFVEDLVDSAETSRITEAALIAISKHVSPIASNIFWQHAHTLASSLFTSPALQNLFILLFASCKVSLLGIKAGETGDAAPRHLGTKLLAIDALREFCKTAGPKVRMSKIMGYQVRRLVVSCITSNIAYALVEPRIFSKLLKLLTILWRKWREHIRIEFPVLCEQLLLKVLLAPTSKILPVYPIMALKEIMKWFEQPHLLIEMFVNFDVDGRVTSDWSIFSHIIRAVCVLAEKASKPLQGVSGTGPWPSESSEAGSTATMFGDNQIPVTPRDVKIKALEVVAQISRAMMDATGHANLIVQDLHTRKMSEGVGGGWVEEDSIVDLTAKRRKSIANRKDFLRTDSTLLSKALKIYQEKESIGKAIKYLVANKFMPETPQEIASFVRVHKQHFDSAALGDFLGEGGRTPEEEKFWTDVRYHYTKAICFVDMDLEAALRLFLTGSGFRMPGEAQKIDRFIVAFVKIFWLDNRNTEHCPFNHEDTVHLLAYATIMLNTDLHRANIDKKKGSKKMTKEAFIHNLRGADQGADINTEYLSRIYDTIAQHPIEMAFDTPAKEVASKDVNSEVTVPELMAAFISDLLLSLRHTEDMLRSLAMYRDKFFVIGVDISISLELVSFMFESVWHNFHAIPDALLTKMANEENVIFAALDILCNSLTSCIFLDLKVEKLAFATQLARFRQLCEKVERTERANSRLEFTGASFATGAFRAEKWFESVEQSTADTAIMAIAEVHTMIVQLKDVIRVCARREATKVVFSRIEKKANIADPNRFLLLEGDLSKKCRSGKFVTYHFFLFSDIFLYAHFGFSEYKVHEQLELENMTVSAQVEEDPTNCRFAVTHPKKSFVCVAESYAVKQMWVRELNEAIFTCQSRRMGRRLSILDRMQTQDAEVSERQSMHKMRPVSMRASKSMRNLEVNPEEGKWSTPSKSTPRQEAMLAKNGEAQFSFASEPSC